MTVELFDHEQWHEQRRQLQRRINGLPYDTRMDCQRMMTNCHATVTQIMSLEVEYRRRSKNASQYLALRDNLSENIDQLEQHVMLAQMMK